MGLVTADNLAEVLMIQETLRRRAGDAAVLSEPGPTGAEFP